jgi:hypothetical protein
MEDDGGTFYSKSDRANRRHEIQLFEDIRTQSDDHIAAKLREFRFNWATDFNWPDPSNARHNTMLHQAASRGLHKTCKVLVSNRDVFVNQLNGYGETAFDVALGAKQDSCVSVIFEYLLQQHEMCVRNKPNQFRRITKRKHESDRDYYHRIHKILAAIGGSHDGEIDFETSRFVHYYTFDSAKLLVAVNDKLIEAVIDTKPFYKYTVKILEKEGKEKKTLKYVDEDDDMSSDSDDDSCEE